MKNIKCINCKHVLFYDDKENVWHHKSTLHNDNCECREPKPDFKPILKEIEKAQDEAIYNKKLQRFDNSRGWNQLTVEEMFRPFTI